MISEKDKELLTRNLPRLMQHISVEGSILLAELRATGVITSHQQEIIQGETGNTNQVGKMLDALLQGGTDTMDKFINALRASGHSEELITDFLCDPIKVDGWQSVPSEGPGSVVNDRGLLERQRATLMTRIDLEDGMLLAELRQRSAITQEQEESIKSEKGKTNQVGKLLDYLLRGDSDTMDKLVHALIACGHDTIVKECLRDPIKPDSDSARAGLLQEAKRKVAKQMSEEDTRLLETNRPILMEHISLENGLLLGHLRAREVIAEPQQEMIKSEKGKYNQVGKLVDILLRGNVDTVDKFSHALNATRHSDLVTKYLREPRTPDTWSGTVTTDSAHSARCDKSLTVLTEELQKAVRSNLQDRLDEWKTPLEEVISEAGEKVRYIDQPITARKKTVAKEQEKQLEFHYGNAGMGTTTLRKHVTSSWLDSQAFVYEKRWECRKLHSLIL